MGSTPIGGFFAFFCIRPLVLQSDSHRGLFRLFCIRPLFLLADSHRGLFRLFASARSSSKPTPDSKHLGQLALVDLTFALAHEGQQHLLSLGTDGALERVGGDWRPPRRAGPTR